MAKKTENQQEPRAEPDPTEASAVATPATGVNTPPMKNSDVDTTVDESPATAFASDFDLNETLREQNKALAEQSHIEVERNDEGDLQRVSVAGAVGINPSSTYPGRDMELAEHDMRIPTSLDLAKRAKFAGTQIPEAVFEAGLADAETGEINVDVPEEEQR